MAGDYDSLKKDIRHRMEQAVEIMKRDFAGLRTGRAHAGLLEPIQVEAYGQMVPITQDRDSRDTGAAFVDCERMGQDHAQVH